MKIKLVKWGNSLGIRLPKIFTAQIGVDIGSEIDVNIQEDALIIRKSTPSLNDLLEQITPENVHEPVDWGEPVGKELW
jgi:antitoxin MazE